MPYETVQEKVLQERRVRVCARCRNPIPDAADRQTYQKVGGVGGSLGASLGGSILLGSVLGPIGAIGGAIAGSIAGARAGRQASDKVCDAVESNHDSFCQACRKLTDTSGSSWGEDNTLGGGQRLGSGEPVRRSSKSNSNPGAGEKIGEATSAAGRGINNGLSWMKQSVTNVIENATKSGDKDGNQSKPPPG
jgi:hypothetical protein